MLLFYYLKYRMWVFITTIIIGVFMVNVPQLSGYICCDFYTQDTEFIYLLKYAMLPDSTFRQEMQIKIVIFVKLCVLINIQEFCSFHCFFKCPSTLSAAFYQFNLIAVASWHQDFAVFEAIQARAVRLLTAVKAGLVRDLLLMFSILMVINSTTQTDQVNLRQKSVSELLSVLDMTWNFRTVAPILYLWR